MHLNNSVTGDEMQTVDTTLPRSSAKMESMCPDDDLTSVGEFCGACLVSVLLCSTSVAKLQSFQVE